MKPYYATPDGKVTLYAGHIIDVLREMPAESVNCVVTSPPYWSLRKYDCEPVIWGGDSECEHEWDGEIRQDERYTGSKRWQHIGAEAQAAGMKVRDLDPNAWGHPKTSDTATCRLCGAWLGQYGLEPTPELYVEHTLMWLRDLNRVLRKDGTVWLNLGDGYAGGGQGTGGKQQYLKDAESGPKVSRGHGVKPKDAVLMPFRVALAAQAEGWWVRSVIIWAKPNPMPESVRDRPTDAHEYIFLLTKSKTYWYDADAIREPFTESTIARISEPTFERQTGGPKDYGKGGRHDRSARRTLENLKRKQDGVGKRQYTGFNDRYDDACPPNGGRNCRSVWTFPTEPFPDAHFAVFPRELPERCIKAGCPEWVCPKCGKARARVTETEYRKNRPSAGSDPRARHEDKLNTLGIDQHYGYRGNNLLADVTTTGWTDCGCGAGFVGGVVLDPFAGSGTTCEVAYHLGRQAWGIDVSAKYLDMAIERVKQGVMI